MSRVGKKPVPLPASVKATISGRTVTVSGPRGSLSFTHVDGVSVEQKGRNLVVTRAGDSSLHKALHGTTRAILNNMVVGVDRGFERKLEIYGTGYSCAVSGQTIELNVGYADPVKLPIPPGVKVTIEVAQTKGDETPARLTVSGYDRQVVGQFARAIKDARPPEPYKGKGVRYAGEQIRRKAGKAFAGTGA